MSRKKLFVDWNTLNQLIQNKDKKAIVMPGNQLWDDAKCIMVPKWVDDNLLHDIDIIFNQQVNDSRDRFVHPEKKEYTNMESQIVNAFRVETVHDEKTVVVLIIKDKANPENNIQMHIHCQDGIGFCGYVRDLAKDSYIAECVNFMSLGNIHASYRVTMPNTGGWTMQVPMPESVIETLISPYYKRALKEAREKYPHPQYELHFMQMTGCD